MLERSSAAFNALPATLVRTKTIQPIRHTVWKTRGEEYRRLGGDGWQWVSATRRQLQADDKRMTLQRLRAKLNGVERPPHLGLGWGVKQELLQQAVSTYLHLSFELWKFKRLISKNILLILFVSSGFAYTSSEAIDSRQQKRRDASNLRCASLPKCSS